MACSFTIGFTGTAESLIERLKSKILTNNGSFGGDESSGNFSIYVLATTIISGRSSIRHIVLLLYHSWNYFFCHIF